MKPTNFTSNFSLNTNSVSVMQNVICRSTKLVSLVGALFALVLFAFTAVPASQAADLFNNFNTAGVLDGPPQAFTVFTLSQPAQITELETYHWFDGKGTPTSVGNIGIWNVSGGTATTMIRAYAAQGVAASFGVIAAWVADTNCAPPGCYLPAGTYAIEDSSQPTWSFNSVSGNHGFAIVRGNFVAAIPAGAIVLTGAPAPAPAPVPPPVNGSILFTNMNSQAVASGVAAGTGTLFTLKTQSSAVEYEISTISTYHFNGGAGAPPGVISIWTTSRQLLFAGNAQGVPGQGGANESWVVKVSPPLKLMPGTYILDDSGHTSWSHDSGSAGCLPFNPGFQCGMGTIFGTMVGIQLQPVRVVPPPIQLSGFPQICDRNSGQPAFILNPCTGSPRAGDVLTIETNRTLAAPFAIVEFSFNSCKFCGLAPAPSTTLVFPAGFATGGGVASGSLYTVTVPPAVCGAAGNAFTSSVWDVVIPVLGVPGRFYYIGRFSPNCN